MTPGEIAAAVDEYVRPDTFPLGIALIQDEAALPAKVRRPARDLGVHVSICQGISMARRYGWTVAMGGEDLSCPIAQIAFGFEPEVPFYSEGSLALNMYTATPEAASRTEEDVPKTKPPEVGFVVAGPLARIDFEPEVILVYGNSAQVMRMVAAALWRRGGSITSSFSARADCAEIVNRTRDTGEPQVILPCYGDRVFGQTQDHEMAFTVPQAMSAEFLEGLEGTHRGGIRYPIPNHLRYEATFPATYEKLKAIFKEQDA